MNKKVGDFLTLVKEIEQQPLRKFTNYTLGHKYQVMHINEKGTYYISNDETKSNKEFYYGRTDVSEEEKTRKILKTCSIWLPNQIDEYFVNIMEQRKEKIKKIKKLFNV